MHDKHEEWRPITEFPDYAASNFGQIKRIVKGHGTGKEGRILKARIYPNGYKMLTVCKDHKKHTKTVHYLVASAFLGSRPAGMHINHRDGVKTNNTPDNLEYMKPADNNRHAFTTGLNVPCQGEGTSAAKLSSDDVLRIVELRRAGFSLGKIAKMYPVSVAALGHIFKGRHWRSITGITPDNCHLYHVGRREVQHVEIELTCKYCGRSFLSKRNDAQSCGDRVCFNKRANEYCKKTRLSGAN